MPKSIFVLAIICFSFVFPLTLDAQSIDFEELFAANEQAVETGVNGRITRRRLELSDVRVTEISESGDFSYVAVDLTEEGAAGCTLMLVLSAKILLNQCAEIGTRKERAIFDKHLSKLFSFVARNSFPAIPPRKIEAEAERWIGQEIEMGGQTQQQCVKEPKDDYRLSIFSYFVSPMAGRDFKGNLSKDRLPVMNPCL